MWILRVNTVSQIYQIYQKLPMKMKFCVKGGWWVGEWVGGGGRLNPLDHIWIHHCRVMWFCCNISLIKWKYTFQHITLTSLYNVYPMFSHNIYSIIPPVRLLLGMSKNGLIRVVILILKIECGNCHQISNSLFHTLFCLTFAFYTVVP